MRPPAASPSAVAPGKAGRFLCVLVTGISGAGRSQAIKCLEDFGFFCVDNLPAPLLPNFADLMVTQGPSMRNVALGIDIREGSFFRNFARDIQAFRSRGISTWILYFDADDATLLRRFSETRRKHPLGKGVLEGIREERKELQEIRARADRIVDTSHLTLSELKEKVASSLPTTLKRTLHLTVYSFGFKYGIPPDADLVWDVRFLPNPHYVPTLKPKTGLAREVRRYVLKKHDGQRFVRQFFALVSDCLPRYLTEGKSHLTIAIGCTGGRHRSVTIAQALAQFLRKKGYPVSVHHRDIEEAT